MQMGSQLKLSMIDVEMHQEVHVEPFHNTTLPLLVKRRNMWPCHFKTLHTCFFSFLFFGNAKLFHQSTPVYLYLILHLKGLWE